MKKKMFRLVENNIFKLNESIMSYDTTITVTDPETDEQRDVDVTVEYDYIPAERGERERGSGAPLTPDDLETIEIISAVDSEGKDYMDKLEDDVIQLIKKEIINYRNDPTAGL